MPTELEILEWLDPDWRDHFRDVEHGADHYRQYAAQEWAAAIKELS
ncbi:MAG: hypothetical protein JWO52_3328 [Gammaproteobacteria bacterium]|nr:hypothetical protein [Gammaproteobacteria bacterium]